jgi:glutamate racemase
MGWFIGTTTEGGAKSSLSIIFFATTHFVLVAQVANQAIWTGTKMLPGRHCVKRCEKAIARKK